MNSRGKSPENSAALQEAIAEEAKSRASSLLSGILRYIETPYQRDMPEAPVIWRRGNARLLDYGLGAAAGKNPQIVLFVPSLINRYYILDLEEERSFLRYLSQQGVYPLVLDWGEPGEFEKNFGCGEYVTELLNPAIDFISKAAHQPITLAGYCMGGVLALAAARLKPKQVSSLALFATPWDFYCKEFSPFVIDEKWRPTIDSVISAQEKLPADVIQSLFYMTDPWVFEQKFRRFAGLQPDSRAAREFIALERWVNDGVAMTAQVGRDCLLGWAQENQLARTQWKVAGKSVDPRKLKMPAFVVIPRADHVVPQGCALPLARALPQAEVIQPRAGHVSMMVGGTARRELWQPFTEWLMGV